MRRKVLIGLGATVLLAGLAGFGFGPVVRARVAAEAARRHLSVDVGGVRPGWFAIRLSNVRCAPEGVAGVEARIGEVRVELTASLALRDVTALGGEIAIDGSPDEITEALRSWRARARASTTAGDGGAGGGGVPLHAEGFHVVWRAPAPGGAAKPLLAVSGLALSKDGFGTKIGLEGARAELEHTSLELGVASVELDPSHAFRAARVTSLNLALAVGHGEASPPPVEANGAATGASPADLAPPPLPMSPGGRRPRPSPKAAAALAPPAVEPDTPLLPLPDTHAMRRRVATLAKLVGEHLPEGSAIAVSGLSLELRLRGERLAMGPGPLSVERRGDKVHIAFSGGAPKEAKDVQATPLSVEADVPLGEGDVVASLEGGPLSLPLLGVQEGAAGLTDVAKTTLAGEGRAVLAAAGDFLSFEGSVHMRGLALRRPSLARDAVRGVDLVLGGRGLLNDRGQLRLESAEAQLGAMKLGVRGSVEQASDHVSASLAFDVPTASCQSFMDSVPGAFFPTVQSTRMSGTFGGKGRLVFDTRHLDDLVLDYDIEDRCQVTEVPPELARDRFTHAFTHRVVHPDGTYGETRTGPGTDNWSDLDEISPYMQVAVLTTEDGAFMRHHGFNHAAIRNALVADLKARKFIRGASTITMQLAKNLFLNREKTLSRKLEELILADYLEQILRKDDMMELYLNVIEFGPDVYGIRRAAEHYFGRRPDELNLAECLYLASIMPSPVRYHRIFERGQVSESWMKHIHQLMEIAMRTGHISRAELNEGLAEAIVFHHQGDPPPAPRAAVTGVRYDTSDDSAAEWRPLD